MDYSAQKKHTRNHVVYFSRCQNNPSGNGGDKRVAQICQILDPFQYDFVSMWDTSFTIPQKLHTLLFNPTGYFQKKRSQIYKQRITYSKYYKWSERYRDHLLYMHLHSQLFIERLHKDPKLLIIDDPVFLAPVVLHAKTRGIPIVAFCQNLETLSRDQVEYSCQREMFSYELELISMCDLVVTISTEETYLLKNFGMDPVYLPYFPLKQTTERFETIREKRKGSIKTDFLLLGTVYNIPTLEGMKRVIKEITDKNILPDDKLIIAGYGTTQLLSFLDAPHIKVCGDVTDAELDELLLTTKGCIVYQETGSGALTKIPELLTAGVPVIINSHAARSHHNLPGIFEFVTFEQLGEQMEVAAQIDWFPQVLSPPATLSLQKRIVEMAAFIDNS